MHWASDKPEVEGIPETNRWNRFGTPMMRALNDNVAEAAQQQHLAFRGVASAAASL